MIEIDLPRKFMARYHEKLLADFDSTLFEVRKKLNLPCPTDGINFVLRTPGIHDSAYSTTPSFKCYVSWLPPKKEDWWKPRLLVTFRWDHSSKIWRWNSKKNKA